MNKINTYNYYSVGTDRAECSGDRVAEKMVTYYLLRPNYVCELFNILKTGDNFSAHNNRPQNNTYLCIFKLGVHALSGDYSPFIGQT